MTRSIQSWRIDRFARIETRRYRLEPSSSSLPPRSRRRRRPTFRHGASSRSKILPARRGWPRSPPISGIFIEAPLLLVFVADLARLRSISDERGHPGIALNYIEAFIFAIADASFAAQNTIVAAELLGLGGCYIGAMRNDPVGVADELALPDEALVIFGMTIGIPDPGIGTDVKPRLPQNVILHRERYSPPDPALLAAYDQRIRDFQAEQKMRVTDWTEQSALRVRDEAALTGERC